MEINKSHWIGISISLILILFSLFLMKTNLFFFVLGIGIMTGVLPFVVSSIKETRDTNEKEEMFLEFARNLVESVSTGTPISKSIINLKKKSYGVLSKHVEKLANQISIGIPLSSALQIFSKDVANKTVSRALTLIGQAEKAGGDIGKILQAVAGAVTMSDRLKKERKTAISTLVVQGYIIFFVFMIILLVMQFQIFPLLSGIADIGDIGIGTGGGGEPIDSKDLADSFLYLMMMQGFFTGLVIGKLAEGHIKYGIKHSFALILSAFIISAGANIVFAA